MTALIILSLKPPGLEQTVNKTNSFLKYKYRLKNYPRFFESFFFASLASQAQLSKTRAHTRTYKTREMDANIWNVEHVYETKWNANQMSKIKTIKI